jgi:hypothetical protein
LIILNFTENKPEGVKPENYRCELCEKQGKYIEKNYEKLFLKEKKKTVLPLWFELTIICLKTFHAQSQRGRKFEIHEIF